MKQKEMFKFNKFDLLIVLLLTGVLLSNYIWLKLDQYPVEGHELMGLTPAVPLYKDLINLRYLFTSNQLYHKISSKFNSFFGSFFGCPFQSYLVVVLFYFLFGLQGQMVVMVNSIYIVLTLVCVYLIGKHIFSRSTGLLAAFILSSFPGFIGFSRVYWIEFGLMGYICLDLYLLLKTNFFENRKYSILLGISLALSFFHKYEFVVFVIGPLLLVIYKSGIVKDILKLKWSNKLTNFILILTLALGLTSFWWRRYGGGILERMVSVATRDENLMFKKSSPVFYLNAIKLLIGILFYIFFFLSIIFMTIKDIIKKERRFYVSFFIVSFIVPYALLTAMKTKNISHILSMLPSIAIVIGSDIYFIKRKLFKIILASLIVIYSLNLHIHPFYSIDKLSSIYPIEVFNVINRLTLRLKEYSFERNLAPFNLPRKERLEYAIKEILEYIKDDSNEKSNAGVFVIYRRDEFNNCVFTYYGLIWNYKIRFSSCFNPMRETSECDYAIVELVDGELVTDMLSRYYSLTRPLKEVRNFKNIFRNGLADFDLIKVYKITNGNTFVFIYKRKANVDPLNKIF